MTPALEAAELPADAVEVGRILDAWGLKGWFKVLPYSAAPEALFSCKRWFLQAGARKAPLFPKPGPDTLLLPIRQTREHAELLVASSPEVLDRNAALALSGLRVFVPRSSFPTPAADEYYWVDLLGLAVFNRQGVALGRVRDLLSTAAQTVLVLEFEHAGQPAQRMIPFVSAYVDAVDLASQRITVDWQTDY